MQNNLMPNNLMIGADPDHLRNNVLVPNVYQPNQQMWVLQANNPAHYPIYPNCFGYAHNTQTTQNFQGPVYVQPNILANREQSNQSVQYSPSIEFPLNKMSVEQVAYVIGDLARFKKWAEARTYSDSFREKKVSGEQIRNMDCETLKCYLGIIKLGHRLEILRVVKELNSDPESCTEVMERCESMSTCSNSETSSVLNRAPSTPELRDELVIRPEKENRSQPTSGDDVPHINLDLSCVFNQIKARKSTVATTAFETS